MVEQKDDLVVNIAESQGGSPKPTTTSAEAPPAAAAGGTAARAKEWLNKSPRNKWIAGGTLAMLLVPLIAAPAIVSQQNQKPQGKNVRVPDWGAYQSVGRNGYGGAFDPLVRATRAGIEDGVLPSPCLSCAA